MQIVPYSRGTFDRVLAPSKEWMANPVLRHGPFVDHYYGSSSHCKLYLAMDDEQGLIGTHGLEQMPFEENGCRRVLGFGSAWFAYRKGIGAYLLMNWLRHCDATLVFGATKDAVAVYQRSKWTFYEGVRSYFLNKNYDEDEDDPRLKRLAKQALTKLTARHRLSELGATLPVDLKRIEVAEQRGYAPDLLDFKSAFRFRFAPDLDYLAWNYSLAAPHVRFRLFKLRAEEQHLGYVILQENDRRITVAQADGADARGLAAGILLAIAARAKSVSDRREVLLASSHPEMQALFEAAGFQNRAEWNRPFAMGRRNGGFQVQVPVTEWLVNYGWGDNAQRPPWREPEGGADAPAAAGNGDRAAAF